EDCDDENVGPRKTTYFSALFGAGIGFATGPGSLLLDLGYQLGLTDISDEEGQTVKSNVFQISLGYRFPLGG
ncbi:MAG: PorT family protein, partial [Gemmatimonadota bacterium]